MDRSMIANGTSVQTLQFGKFREGDVSGEKDARQIDE